MSNLIKLYTYNLHILQYVNYVTMKRERGKEDRLCSQKARKPCKVVQRRSYPLRPSPPAEGSMLLPAQLTFLRPPHISKTQAVSKPLPYELSCQYLTRLPKQKSSFINLPRCRGESWAGRGLVLLAFPTPSPCYHPAFLRTHGGPAPVVAQETQRK